MHFTQKSPFRRFRAALYVCCILIVCFSSSLPVRAQTGAKLTASSLSAERGTIVSVTVALNGNPGLWGIKLKVGYDSSALTLSSVANGTLFADGDMTLPETLNKEPFVYVATSNGLKDITANGALVTLKFKVSGNAEWKAYPITVSLTQAINAAGKDVGMDIQNGAITVVKCIHNKVWRTTQAPGYNAEGIETEICSKCGEIFSTRPIKALSGSASSLVEENESEAQNSEGADTSEGTASEPGKDPAKTADNTLLLIVVLIVVLCAAGAAAFIIIKKRRK